MTESDAPKFIVSTDKSMLDISLISSFLSKTYWAKGRPRSVVEKSIKNSLCFGLYKEDKQIGFARVITDYAIFAYLADVFVIEKFRGQGAGKKLLHEILNYPELSGIKKWMLATADAQDLYSKFGFIPLKTPDKYMEFTPSKKEQE